MQDKARNKICLHEKLSQKSTNYTMYVNYLKDNFQISEKLLT